MAAVVAVGAAIGTIGTVVVAAVVAVGTAIGMVVVNVIGTAAGAGVGAAIVAVRTMVQAPTDVMAGEAVVVVGIGIVGAHPPAVGDHEFELIASQECKCIVSPFYL